MNNIVVLLSNLFTYGVLFALSVATFAIPYFLIQEYDWSWWWYPVLLVGCLASTKFVFSLIFLAFIVLVKLLDALGLTNRNF